MKSLLSKIAIAALVGSFAGNFAMAQDEPTILGPGSKVYVKIAQSPDLVGELLELDSIKVTTSFGEVAIPMTKIDGIKMNIGGDGTAVVAFANGDLVTGKIKIDNLLLKTSWGRAHIDPIHIETITTTKDGRFFQDGAAGSGGWRFSKAIAPARSSGRTNSRTSATPTTTSRQFGQ